MSDKAKKIRVYSSGAPDQAKSESSVQLHETLTAEELLRIRDVARMASKKTSGKAASASGASVSKVSKAKKVAEKLTTLPPPSTKVPTQKQEQTMSVFEGQRELEKLQKSYLSTTVTEELMKFVPEDLRAIKKDGIVDIPLGRIVLEDPVINGKKVCLNPRQINQQGVDDISRRFYTMGYNSTSPVVVLVLKYNGQPFRNTRNNVAEWDEVEREKNDWWKAALIETKNKNKLSPWLLENVAGKENDRLGYVGLPGDGKHRVKAFKDTQMQFFNTKAKEFQPPKRHPSIRCLIVNVTDENLAEFLELCIKINDQTSGGIQSMTLPLQIMNVRRIMQSLTEKQLVEMNAQRTLDALVAMTNNKLKPVMTYYKSWTTGEIMKVPKLWVALMVDKIFEQDIAAWTVPDDDKNQPLFDMCQAKENQFTRLIVAAFPGAGSDYDAVLSMITSAPDVAKSLGKEDLYSLCAAGISTDWIIETAKRVLCLSKDAAEALGFPRVQEKFRAFCGRLTYTYQVMLAGLEWLRELGVLKKEPVKKGAPPDDSWTPASVDIRRAFMKGGKFVDYPTWMYEVALSEGEKGEYGRRYLAKQAKACKTKGKGESMDVPAVGKRSVCQYLQWLFKPEEGWDDVETLYGNVPELQNLRAVVVDAIKTDKVIGQQWESESFGSTIFSQDEERQMAYPIERDSGGVVPKTLVDGKLATVYKRKYISRKERAEAMGLDVVEPEKEPEGGEKAKKTEEKLSFSAATVYNLVDLSGAFTVPTLEELRVGLEDVCMLQPGEWREQQKGVELVWLNLPLPGRVVDEEAIAGFEPQSQMEEWETETVREGVERGLSLLTGAGVLIVVGPAGVHPSLLQRQVDHAGPSKIRSTIFVTVNPKNKKGEIEYLYGCLGNTLAVYYVTIDDSAKSSVLTSSGVTETLKGAAFRAVLRKNGSYLALTWPEWEKGGKGLPLPVVQSLLGGLAKKKGTAVVINAKGGREVSALSKAGMNVVAAFSEGKSEYPGLLVDSKSGHKFGFEEMEQASTVGPVVQQEGGAKSPELAAAEKLARKRNRRAGERVIESSPEPEEEGGDAQASAEGEGQAKAPEAAEGESGKGRLSAEALGVEKAQGAAQGEGGNKEEGEGQEKGQKGTEKAADSAEGKEKGGEVGGEGEVEGNEEGGEEEGEEPDPGLEFGDAQFEQYFASLPSAKDGAGGKTEVGEIGGGGGAAGGRGPAAVVTSPLVTPLTVTQVTPVSSGTPQSKTPRDGATLPGPVRDDMDRLAELEAAADEGRLLTDEESTELTTLRRAKRKREEEGGEEEEMAGGKLAKKGGGRGAREEYLAQVRAAKEMEAAQAAAIAAAGGATGVSGKSGGGQGDLSAEDQAAIYAALVENQRPRRGKGKK